MKEKDLKTYLCENYSKENESVEWKAWTGYSNWIRGSRKDDLISYVSGIANAGGGVLVIGIEDQSLDILGIQMKKTREQVELEVLKSVYPEHKIHISEEITEDTNKKVWIVKIPKYPFRQEVVAHNEAYMRSNDSLVELSPFEKEKIRIEANRQVYKK